MSRGRYVLVGIVNQDITFSDPEFHKREMQLIGSRNTTKHDFRMVIDMIRDGLIPVDKLHTHSLTKRLRSKRPMACRADGA
jgi:threonine dehydrogenase-like Zn-dependent dehydrogenase